MCLHRLQQCIHIILKLHLLQRQVLYLRAIRRTFHCIGSGEIGIRCLYQNRFRRIYREINNLVVYPQTVKFRGDGELKINTEAVKSIHFDFKSDKDNIKGTPFMSEDKPWMKFLKDLPKNFGDTTKWVRPNFVRLTPYTPYTTWHEDPVNDPIFLKRKDSLTISWKLNIKLIPGLRNGYVILPAGMDQTVTPSNNPLIGGLDADNFLYESLTKRGRAIRRNRNRAKGWKIYQSYVPTRQDSILFPRISKVSEQDSLPKQDTLLIKKDSAIINQNSLLLKDKINGKDQTKKSR